MNRQTKILKQLEQTKKNRNWVTEEKMGVYQQGQEGSGHASSPQKNLPNRA